MSTYPQPCKNNDFLLEHIGILLDSYYHWTAKNLIDPQLTRLEAARYIYFAPFALVSHNTDQDPVFNYANKTALTLFEMSWDEFTSLPSRKSAEPPCQHERAKFLSKVSQEGYIDDYSGVRISKTKKNFLIKNATVWNLLSAEAQHYGQAAFFSDWIYL